MIVPDRSTSYSGGSHSGPRDPTGAPSRALLVTDDVPGSTDVLANMQQRGFTVVIAPTVVNALELLGAQPVDLVVLGGGIDENVVPLLAQIRARSAASIVILGHGQRTRGGIIGLEPGSDPPNATGTEPAERQADVTDEQASAMLRVGDLVLDPVYRTARLAGRPLQLSYTEYRLLVQLATNRGVPQSWRQLLRVVWQVSDDIGGRDIVKSTIYRLRARLADAGADTEYIRTLRGAGYLMPNISISTPHNI